MFECCPTRNAIQDARKNNNARDRLLPKLMGGEMDVFLENYPAV